MTFDTDVMDLICPMHMVLDADARVRFAGPTLRKMRPWRDWTDVPFFDVFHVTRPRGVEGAQALKALSGQSLSLRFCDEPSTLLKALVVSPRGSTDLLINVSFGISIQEAVQDYDLNITDFAPTDLAVEMLYLIEAKSAAMDASKRLNQRLQVAKTHAEHSAITDALTGVQNRRGFQIMLDRALQRPAGFALIHVDLDHFKYINDTFGHAAGDEVLQFVARVMSDSTRDRDAIARVGGDEFVLVIDNDPDAETVERIAERILDGLQKPLTFGGETCAVSCSMGSVLSRYYDTPEAETLMNDADRALYRSKLNGRGRHCLFHPTEAHSSQDA